LRNKAFSRPRNTQISSSAACKTKQAAAPRTSHSSLLHFDRRARTLFAILQAILVIITVFKINGSSLAAWNAVFGFKTDTGILFGSPRGIRIDEWSLHTPALLSQLNSAKPFSTTNYALGGYRPPFSRPIW
jgi:hypothetical protein